MHGICKPFQVNFHVLPLKKLSKEKRWGGVPSFIKEQKSANLSLKNLLHFCMEDSKNPIASY
jgi:hypothetical protein